MTRNSAVRGVILAVLASMIAFIGGLVSPASAAEPPLPAPVANDLCGVSKDQVYLADDSDPYTQVGWQDSTGAYYNAGQGNSTKSASSLTLTVEIWGANGLTTYTYPPITFGVESDSGCALALDTVTVSDLTCMPNGGTRATFTYVNTPDNGWPQTSPSLVADRWDMGQYAAFNLVTPGVTVAEGASVSMTGGDTLEIKTDRQFFLAPGTYNMWVRTAESGQRKLPNTFFVPACGDNKVPPGDPSGQGRPGGSGNGAVKPRGVLSQVSPSKLKVKAINRGVARGTTFKVVIDPVKGETVTKSFKVASGTSTVRKYSVSPRAKVMLKARFLVKQANGQSSMKWYVLAQASIT